MEIGGLQKTTLIDYPGHVACTIFFCGCNFRCPWCYAKELVLPELIVKQPKISQQELSVFLEKNRGLLEGVVLCGGEPTLNSELPALIKKIKNMGFLVKLDTNGSNPQMLKKLLDNNLLDYAAMDVKLPKEKYSLVFDNRQVEALAQTEMLRSIEQSIFILKNSNIDFEFRTTITPSVHSTSDIVAIARWIGTEIPGRKPKYFLQNFQPKKTIDPRFESYRPLPPEFFDEVLPQIMPFVASVYVRG